VYYFLIPFIIGALIQGIKVVIDTIDKKKFDICYLRWSWGFPSVHSGVSSSLITLCFLIEGPESITFAIALTFGFFLRYDAVNLRYETGKHAHQINSIQDKIEKKSTYRFQQLKERIGHTPREVLGGIIVWSTGTRIIFLFSKSILIT